VNPRPVDRISEKLKIRAPRPVLEWLLAPEGINRIVEAARETPETFFAGALKSIDVELACSEADRRRIPTKGPALLVCNHPFGMLEGLLLGALLERHREDYRFVAHTLLASIPEIAECILPVDPFSSRDSMRENVQSLRRAQQWLQQGGLLVTFPAGEVSNLQGMPPAVIDPAWNTRLFRIAKRQGVPVIPAFFHGRNSLTFQFAGLLYPAIRSALLCRELMNKRGGRFTLAVGTPIRPEQMGQFKTDRDLTEYVRDRAYALGHRGARATHRATSRQLIAPPQPTMVLEREISALPPEALVFAKGDYRGYVTTAAEIPEVLKEIGRLREISFRVAGEGSGLARDIDRFDQHYKHLFLWKASAREIAGGYRLAEVDRVLDQHGADGLYTHTLFRFEPEFLERLRPGLELGRSFIRPEYQRSVHPLHYLWKAIGAYLARDPRRYLFGPVSISEEYGEAARELIVAWFEERIRERVVRPRCAFRSRNLSHLGALARQARTLSDLCEVISDLESDGREIPVLLRHYLNLGGEVLGFNVDRGFSNALDGLLLLDVENGNSAVLSRYLGTTPHAKSA